MYTKCEGDSGLCTKSLEYDFENKKEIEFQLDNGQIDLYPERWIIDDNTIRKVLVEFCNTGSKDSFVEWIEDDRY